MYYKYNFYGFYDGATTQALHRTTTVAPVNTSLTTTPGEPRANWTGYEWRNQAYYTPVSRTISRFTKKQFRSRLTLPKLIAIEVALPTDPVLQVLKDDLLVAEYIDITDSETIDGIAYLVTKGILTQQEADAILTVETIPEVDPYPDEV